MVKNSEISEMPVSVFTGKRVSFDANCKTEDISSGTTESPRTISNSGFERILNVADTNNTTRTDSAKGIMGNPGTRKNCSNQNQTVPVLLKTNTIDYNIAQDMEVQSPGELQVSQLCDRTDSMNQLSLVEVVELPFAYQIVDDSCSVDSGKNPESRTIEGLAAVGKVPSVLAKSSDSVETPGDKAKQPVVAKDALNDKNIGGAHQGSVEGDVQPYCRGYSRQRRHGRKASLGTSDFSKLIPTLVSENEDFRYEEYYRKLSAHPKDLLSDFPPKPGGIIPKGLGLLPKPEIDLPELTMV